MSTNRSGAGAPVLSRACLGLVLVLSAQVAAGRSDLSEDQVIQKLPCRASKYSDKPVCPAVVVTRARAAGAQTPPVEKTAPLKPAVVAKPAVTKTGSGPPAARSATGRPAARAGQSLAMVVPGVQPSGATSQVLPQELLSIAQQVERGTVACELGAFVTVADLPDAPGHFTVSGRNFRYHMMPVVSTTGAIRLEDPKAGAVWLQLPEKSMLMNQRQGVRLADACVTTAQAEQARSALANATPGLLDGQSRSAQDTTPTIPQVARSVQ